MTMPGRVMGIISSYYQMDLNEKRPIFGCCSCSIFVFNSISRDLVPSSVVFCNCISVCSGQ